ncbi:MAG: DUF4386 domain-containing protein [Maribacter sp.]|nr:DUF4386 domain-containing protein [Maribacter sp.]
MGNTLNNLDKSRQRTVKITGFMFLFAFIVPTLNWALVLSKFNVAGDALATANNILANTFLFRLGITVELFLSTGLIVLGMALYVLLKSINKNLAQLALVLKLVEAALMAVSVLLPFIALQALNEDLQAIAVTQEQLQLPLGLIFNAHTAITAVPMVFLGLDMMLFCYLFLKSKFIPKLLAGFGILSFALILIQSLLFILTPEIASIPINQIIFWGPSGVFEIVIGLWLLIKGIKVNAQT